MIMLSKLSFSPNIDMFLSFLSFWNSSINAFIFSLGIMSPLLFDVATMLGLLIIGNHIPTLYDEEFEDLNCPIYKEIAGYGKYMKEYKQDQGNVSKTEHNAFVIFWL